MPGISEMLYLAILPEYLIFFFILYLFLMPQIQIAVRCFNYPLLKGATEDEIFGWHHQLNGHESEQTLGVAEGQGSLA